MTTNTDSVAVLREYAERDVLALRKHYVKHVAAMTAEGLYDKSAIAAELAWRDAEIERLRALRQGGEAELPPEGQALSWVASAYNGDTFTKWNMEVAYSAGWQAHARRAAPHMGEEATPREGPTMYECRVILRNGFGKWRACSRMQYDHIRLTGHYQGPCGAPCEARALPSAPAQEGEGA